MTYSIAIRTLGTNPLLLRQELESIFRQSIQPQKVVLYIANGYERPPFQIGYEQYIWVKKGMMSQRLQPCREIESDLILFLDDDVLLAEDTVEKLQNALVDNMADCVGADMFASHDMSLKSKIYAAITNWVFPHSNDGWADKIRCFGSLSYTNSVSATIMPTQTLGGPCQLWRKESYERLHFEDELWMEDLSQFTYGDDMVITYKLFKNNGKLLMHYNSGAINLNGKSASNNYHKNKKKFYVRSLLSFCNWWRIVYEPHTCQTLVAIAFCLKEIWLFFIHLGVAIIKLSPTIIFYYLKGIKDGWNYVHSDSYKKIPKYILAS